jgi:small subunit ribosomal protein S16
MVKIRLTRVGRKKSPAYRIVVADSRAARDGRNIEMLGWYQPLNKEKAFELNSEKALHWLKQGAIPSDTIKSLLRQTGVMKEFHEHKVELAAKRKARRSGSAESSVATETSAAVETEAAAPDAEPVAPVQPEPPVQSEDEQPAAPAQ